MITCFRKSDLMHTMSNKFSFILPAYKAKYFHQAINSILNQTYTDFELVIVNDASPEDLDSIVDSFDDSRIRYYKNNENIGGGNLVAQWNKCLEYATGDYVILASDDDLYFPDYLSKMSTLIDKYPDVNVFRPRVQIIDGNNDILRVEGYLVENISSLEFMYLLQHRMIYGGIPYYIFKKEALLDIGGFIEFPMAWGSDDATVIELSKEKGIASTTEVLFSFRMSGENITTKQNDYNSLRRKIKARDKFYYFQKSALENISPMSSLDEIYLDYLNNNMQAAIIRSIYDLICDSTLAACIRCLPVLKTLPYIKNRWLIVSYAKKIGQTLIYK